jgi:hypothetical protein
LIADGLESLGCCESTFTDEDERAFAKVYHSQKFDLWTMDLVVGDVLKCMATFTDVAHSVCMKIWFTSGKILQCKIVPAKRKETSGENQAW